VWLYAYFKGPFLCSNCQAHAAKIILRLKKRLEKQRKQLAAEDRKKKNGAMMAAINMPSLSKKCEEPGVRFVFLPPAMGE
jgi:hypothetical protein